LNGIDVLEKNNFKELNGLRVGLVTNHTGRNLSGKQTIDVLKEAQKRQTRRAVRARTRHSRAARPGKNQRFKDEKTGLPIYSLYGETRRPKPEHLKIWTRLFSTFKTSARAFTLYFHASKRDGRSRESRKTRFRFRPPESD
jgi:uncharacterized protein YbbC (DUF1343 family)